MNSHEFKASLLYKASSGEPGLHSKSLSQETKLTIALSSARVLSDESARCAGMHGSLSSVPGL